MNSIEDGIIKGNVEPNRQECGYCGWPTRCIRIHRINLPSDLKPSTSLIPYYVKLPTQLDRPRFSHLTFLGLGCGCYARFHRQIAHILQRRKDAGHS